MVKVISDEEYETLQRCKSGIDQSIVPTVSVIGPRDNLVELSLEISEVRKEILDENYIKNTLNADVGLEANKDSKIVAEAVKNIATQFNKNNIGHLIVLEVKNSFNRIYTASYLIINEINTVFSTVSDDDLTKLENLYTDTELYFTYIKQFLESYDNFLLVKEQHLLVRQSTLLEIQSRQLSNVICRLILDIKEYDSNIVEREIYKEYYTKEFCPDTFKEIDNEAEKTGLFASIKAKFKNFLEGVKATSIGIQQAFRKTVNHPLYKVIGFLTKRYTLLYISYVIIFNIAPGTVSQVTSGNFGFVDICIALSTAICRSFSDPLILGQFIKLFLAFILSAVPMVNLSSKLRDVTGVIVGNAVTFLGPLMLYSSVKNILAFILSCCCDSWQFASTTSLEVYRYSSETVKTLTAKFNEILSKHPDDPIGVIKEWIVVIGSDGSSEISRLFLKMFPMIENFTGWIFSPITSIYSSISSKVSNLFSISDTGEILKIADKTSSDMITSVVTETIQENDSRMIIYSSILRGTKECILKGSDIVTSYIGVVISTLLENKSISSCIDKFKSLYDTSYYYLQWILFVKATFVESSEILYFNSDRTLINELGRLNLDLKQNINYLKLKDETRNKLFEVQKNLEPTLDKKRRFEDPFNIKFEGKQQLDFKNPYKIKIEEFEEPTEIEIDEESEPDNQIVIQDDNRKKRRFDELEFEGPKEKIDYENIKFEN
jgi:hypothetical protein